MRHLCCVLALEVGQHKLGWGVGLTGTHIDGWLDPEHLHWASTKVQSAQPESAGAAVSDGHQSISSSVIISSQVQSLAPGENDKNALHYWRQAEPCSQQPHPPSTGISPVAIVAIRCCCCRLTLTLRAWYSPSRRRLLLLSSRCGTYIQLFGSTTQHIRRPVQLSTLWTCRRANPKTLPLFLRHQAYMGLFL